MLESLGIFKNPMARLHPRPRKELRLGTGISVFSKAAGQLQVQLGGEQLSYWLAPALDADGPGVVQVLGSLS